MKKYSRPLKGSEFFTSWVSSFIWKYTILLCVLLQEKALNQCENTLEGKTLKQVDLLLRHGIFFNFQGTFSLLKRRIIRVNYTFHGLLRTFFLEDPPASGLLLLTGRLRTQGKACCRSLISYCRGKDPTLQFAPIIPRRNREKGKMVEVNWPEWIVLRCEPKLIQMEI